MRLKGSLEQDIFDVFRKEDRPLNVLEIWDALDRKGIQVPVMYLNRILFAMVRFDLMERASERPGHPAYQPIGIRLPGKLLKNVRQALMRQIQDNGWIERKSILIRKICLGAFLSVCLGLSALGYSESLPESETITLPPVALDEKSIQQPVQLVQGDTVSDNTASSPNTATPTIVPILTTRPSFTDAWLSVPKGSFQAENGATYTDNSNHTKNWVLPESLLKVGLSKNTELRFAAPNYTYLGQDNGYTLVNNLGDIAVGLGHHIALPGKVDMLIVPFLNIPTGANKASSNSLDPQVRMVAAKYLTPKLVLASQMDARWNTGRDEITKVILNPTLIGYYSLTDKFTGFAEYGGFVPTQGKSTHYLQGGLLYLLTKRQQIDVRVATGLNKASSDFLVGFGYSFRIDGLFK